MSCAGEQLTASELLKAGAMSAMQGDTASAKGSYAQALELYCEAADQSPVDLARTMKMMANRCGCSAQ